MRYTEFLLEYDRSREQNRIEAVGAYQTRQKQDPEFSLEKLESADPTPQKIYVPRLATWWLAGEPVADLISTTADALDLYHQLRIKKLIGSEHADIGRFKTADQFTKFMASQDAKFRGKYTKIFKDSKLEVVQLLDKTAAQWWGQGTKWCTKGQDNNQFDYYAAKGPLYVIVDRVNNTRYQLWWDQKDAYQFQFMDVQDKEVVPTQLPFYHQLQPIFAPLHPHLMWQTNLSPADQLAAVRKNPKSIKYILNPEPEVQMAAVQKNSLSIKYILNPEPEVQMAAVGWDGNAIYHIKDPSPEVQERAVQQNGWAIEWIDDPSEKVQLAAVGQDPAAIRRITDPSLEVQMKAVRRLGYVIAWITNPKPGVQEAAVGQDGNAIRHITDPKLPVQMKAVEQSPAAIRYIKKPDPEVQMKAVELWGGAIELITKPTAEAQMAAVEKDPGLVWRIRQPTPAVRARARQLKQLGQTK